MAKIRIPLHEDPWFLLQLPVVIWLEPKYIHNKFLRNAVKRDARFVKIFKIHILFKVV